MKSAMRRRTWALTKAPRTSTRSTPTVTAIAPRNRRRSPARSVIRPTAGRREEPCVALMDRATLEPLDLDTRVVETGALPQVRQSGRGEGRRRHSVLGVVAPETLGKNREPRPQSGIPARPADHL